MPSLGDVAGSLGLQFRGDPGLSLTGLAALDAAGPSQLSFVAQPKYLASLGQCRAGALILKPDWVSAWSGPCLLSDHPYLAYAQATRVFDNRPPLAVGIHPTAQIDPSATLGLDVAVGPHAVVGAGVELGAGVVVGAGVVIGAGCVVGPATVLHPGVVLYYGVTLGAQCTVHANTVIGSDGFGYAPRAGQWEKILQLAGVRIGDRCDIGASTTIDRGALHDTVIGDDVIIDNQVHIAHGVVIGKGTALAAAAAIAGSTRIGERCQLAGQVGVGDHIELADDVHVAGQGRVSGSLLSPGHYASGTPVQPFAEWRRSAVRYTQLEQLARRVRDMEKALAAMALPGVAGTANDNKEHQP